MITGNSLRNAIISGANNITKNKSLIDSLNIFPVPDGDTGTNMSMTMISAVSELENIIDEKIEIISKKTASALLKGARGNSGVILSLLFRGFSKGFEDLDEADGIDLVKALGLGVSAAYNAVMNPTEGTILTVSRVAYEYGMKALEENIDPIYIWSQVCKGAKESLKTTPNLLPVLKKAGVVDAGGKGLCLIFDGMLSVFKNGKIIENIVNNDTPSNEESSLFNDAELEEISFTYCTEYIVRKDNPTTKDPQELRKYLSIIGDCVVVVDDEEIIKVHIHTENPGDALQEGLGYGDLLTVKIENMKEQYNNITKKNKSKLEPCEPIDKFGFVAVSAGKGLDNLFKDLGCTHVVSGGQTMNPSTDDILEAILATSAKTVYVLPNNKNIIMAAKQTINLVDNRKVIVIPSKTIPQGISAMLAFDIDSTELENSENMNEAMNNVSTGLVTFAARDAEFGEFKIKENEILALDNGKLVFTEKTPVKAIVKLTKSLVTKNTTFVTLIYGLNVTDKEAKEALNLIKSKINSHIDITLIKGDQPVYYFIVSVE